MWELRSSVKEKRTKRSEKPFMDSIAAKQFLISRVVEQADCDHVPLSDIEKKMLHFTEVHPTLPDIYEVNADFERTYDSDEYEAKIARLIKKARDCDRARSSVEAQHWNDAIDALKTEDHYILVMLHAALPEYRDTISPTHRLRDYIIYIAVGIGLVVSIIVIAQWRVAR